MFKCIVWCCVLKVAHITFSFVGTLCPFWPKAFRVINYALTLSVICSAIRSSLLWRWAKFIFATMVSQNWGNAPDKKASILFLDRYSNVNAKQVLAIGNCNWWVCCSGGSKIGYRLGYGEGHGSSVGIATRYGLDGPGIESLWGARFSAPIQTGPGAHPASFKIGTGSFPG